MLRCGETRDALCRRKLQPRQSSGTALRLEMPPGFLPPADTVSFVGAGTVRTLTPRTLPSLCDRSAPAFRRAFPVRIVTCAHAVTGRDLNVTVPVPACYSGARTHSPDPAWHGAVCPDCWGQLWNFGVCPPIRTDTTSSQPQRHLTCLLLSHANVLKKPPRIALWRCL